MIPGHWPDCKCDLCDKYNKYATKEDKEAFMEKHIKEQIEKEKPKRCPLGSVFGEE